MGPQWCKLENCPLSAVSLHPEQLNHVICFLMRPWLARLILYSTNKKEVTPPHIFSYHLEYPHILQLCASEIAREAATGSCLFYFSGAKQGFSCMSYQECSKNQMDVNVLRRAVCCTYMKHCYHYCCYYRDRSTQVLTVVLTKDVWMLSLSLFPSV